MITSLIALLLLPPLAFSLVCRALAPQRHRLASRRVLELPGSALTPREGLVPDGASRTRGRCLEMAPLHL